MLAACGALLANILLVLLVMVPAQRDDAGLQLRTLASVVAANVAAATAAEDGVLAKELLTSLRSETAVEQAVLLGRSGRVLASFSATGPAGGAGALGERAGWLQQARAQSQATQRYAGLFQVEVVCPVLQGGELLGHVYLTANLRSLRDRLFGTLAIMVGVTLLVLAAIRLVANRLQRNAIAPILGLLSLLRAVARDGDYSLRAPPGGRDEIGMLVDSCNAMLGQFGERDAELQRQRQSLEDLIAERTRNLEQTNKNLGEIAARNAAALQAAAAASQAKSEFLARVSHEIRTPLQGVMAVTELLLETPLDGRQKRCAESIQSSVDALLGIGNEILEFSRLEAGQLPLEIGDCDLRRLLEEAVELFAKRAQDKNLELAIDIDPQLQNMLRGDAARLRQVFMNLISNATKFTMRGAVVARLKILTRSADRQVRLRIEVCDTGIGIRAEKRAAIFESQAQEDGSTARRFGGSGLGLAICRQLIEHMGGRIGVDSEFGRGSTFHLELSLEESAEPSQSGAVYTLHPGRRLLVVDDSAINREIMQTQLAGLGLAITLVGDGEQAVAEFASAAAAKAPFDLLVLDWQMPGIDGIETLRRIRARDDGRTVPALILSSLAQQPSRQLLAELAPVSRLCKPVRQAALRLGVARMLAAEPAFAGADILLVDDNANNRELVTDMLRAENCRLTTAGSGSAALVLLSQRSFDIVLMDCQMPDMDGFETTHRLRRWELDNAQPATRILALAANAQEGNREHCLLMGMDDCLAKPFTRSQLIAKLVELQSQSVSASGAAIAAPQDFDAVLVARQRARQHK